ncbi:glycosyltransferase family 1 protein [Spongiibacter sp. KMU-158]|uniref:Glycosyltransferase family 1 protein n=1 Tax=Spongiibacter pelagi TaxID=2760804 RepID=A0A927GV37_9GAMM|nr:glycosyltransferase [Spongiibacter pelagi]MBD2857477.1 glycosyltransferase family 1 protein [Spongiibacter pelagi]
MRIVIFSIGTQGDVRPFVALGVALQQLGHRVVIASGASCAALIQENDLEYAPLSADFLEVMASDPRAIQKGLNPIALVPTVRKHLRNMASDWSTQAQSAVAGAELIIGNGMVALLASTMAELVGAKCVETQLQPVTPCPDIPPMVLKPGRKKLPGAVNLGLYQFARVLTWQMLGAAYAQLRRDLKLKPYPWYGPYYRQESRDRYRLLAYSPSLLAPSPHWPQNIKVVGNFYLEQAASWTPPESLEAFLAAGEKPIYIGFGSMVAEDKSTFSERILAGILASGRRAIIASGWGGLEISANKNCYVLDAAPHDWLFPKVALAVHHGGAGTTAAAARAGIPSVIIPFFGDQPFWAWTLLQAGAAPTALDRKTFTAEQFAAAVNLAHSEIMQGKAAELGEKMRRENGVAEAIRCMTEAGLLDAVAAEESLRVIDGELQRCVG